MQIGEYFDDESKNDDLDQLFAAYLKHTVLALKWK